MEFDNGKVIVTYIRSNEIYDIYHIIAYNVNEYIKRLRSSETSESDIAALYI